MSGRMSRRKGAEGERQLCRYLLLRGYDARRVIRTRAVGGYEEDVVPDVIATKDGIEYTFENKCRNNAFGTIYDIYNRLQHEAGVYRFSIPQATGPLCIAIGTNFESVRSSRDVDFRRISLDGSREAKAHMKVTRLQKWLKGAQFLVIKDNARPMLFIRYWG